MEIWRNELYHHGILGQKWGIRRYQNEDGSLTAAGRKRYNVNIEKADKAYQKAKNKAKYAYATEDKRVAEKKVEWAKEDLSQERIKAKLNNEKRISKHRQKLIDLYKGKGMTQEEAEVAAYKRERVETALKVALGVTVTAAVAYGAYKYYKYSADELIPPGAVMSRISANPDKAVHDGFYAAINESDKHKYKSLYANQIIDRQRLIRQPEQVYQKKVDVKTGLKVASTKHSIDTLRELYNNDFDFRQDVNSKLIARSIQGGSPKQVNTIKKAVKSLGSGKINENFYDAFNLVLSGSGNAPYAQKFRQALKAKGYDAIRDVNDMKLSGYRAKNPLIVLDASKVAVSAVEQLDNNWVRTEGQKTLNKVNNEAAANEAATAVGMEAAVGLGIITAEVVSNKISESRQNDKIVRDYREQHPNTKMSYTEILRSQKSA